MTDILNDAGNGSAAPATIRIPPGRKTRPEKGDRKYGRAAVSNGTDVLMDIDGRTAIARRFRDLLNQITNDLGGAENLSTGQKQLARRCAMISVKCEKLESDMAADKEIDFVLYGVLTDRLGRTLQRLGLKRHAKDIETMPPTPEEYFKWKQQKKQEQNDE